MPPVSSTTSWPGPGARRHLQRRPGPGQRCRAPSRPLAVRLLIGRVVRALGISPTVVREGVGGTRASCVAAGSRKHARFRIAGNNRDTRATSPSPSTRATSPSPSPSPVGALRPDDLSSTLRSAPEGVSAIGWGATASGVPRVPLDRCARGWRVHQTSPARPEPLGCWSSGGAGVSAAGTTRHRALPVPGLPAADAPCGTARRAANVRRRSPPTMEVRPAQVVKRVTWIFPSTTPRRPRRDGENTSLPGIKRGQGSARTEGPRRPRRWIGPGRRNTSACTSWRIRGPPSLRRTGSPPPG